uniref:ATP synthase complex subunit 8 n=1 Tax=Pyrrhidium sanguineum TaxID=1323404 RepID=A0A343C3L3_9CUCU|nr:ATP synthase F0 subunit 8 [Pyrrhidium sanguineum]QVM79208.1 ATP synthase F0 subunit 8 [Pyrrhidium sanguineum]
MPQMAPMNWLTLELFFTFMFLLFNMINYFSFSYSPASSLKSKLQINIKWPW